MNIHDELKRLNAKCDRLAELLRKSQALVLVSAETCERLERERDQWKADCLEQCKLLAMSADREEKLRAELHHARVCFIAAMELAERYKAERDEAREALQQWRDAAKGAENPHPDEVHCTCVPLLISKIAALRKERDEARDVLRIFADCRNWFHTAKEEGGPYTAWRGKREPDEIAEAALKEAAK
jgi:phage I-like protein